MWKPMLPALMMLALVSSCGSDSANSSGSRSSDVTAISSTSTSAKAQSYCTGTATACSRFSVYSCEQQQGCRVGINVPPTCSGRAASCRTFYYQDDCEQQ